MDSPFLKHLLADCITTEYPDARTDAIYETNLDKALLPVVCPYTQEQLLASDFWPE